MKGVVFIGERKTELREFPDPQPGPRGVILEIKAYGMCGTDLKGYREPFIPGAGAKPADHFAVQLRRVLHLAMVSLHFGVPKPGAVVVGVKMQQLFPRPASLVSVTRVPQLQVGPGAAHAVERAALRVRAKTLARIRRLQVCRQLQRLVQSGTRGTEPLASSTITLLLAINGPAQ